MDRVIWTDAEAYMGRGIKDPENDHEYNTTEYHSGPENKRECPCDTCPLFEECAVKGTECSAFRNWGTDGDYKDTDVQRLLRVLRESVMSTKEFTYQEIEELNKEFNTANAFTKWKFMQTPEYAKLPDAVRYTVEKECLTHYFNILTDGMPDWKLPISGVIPIALLNPFRAAVEYFTGTELSVIEQDGTNFKVFAKGYYMMGD